MTSPVVIDATRPGPGLGLAELWRYRDLLWILALRDLQVRYRQALIGAAWAVVQPVAAMLVFGLLFGLLGRRPASGVVPYAVTLYCGLLPWQLFATSLNAASRSLVENRQVLTKVYFPRVLLPMAGILCALVDFAIAMVVLGGLMAWHAVVPGWALVTMPLWVFLVVLVALAAGLWLAALTALYRDFGYVVPLIVQIGFFLSPVVYETTSLIPRQWQLLYSLNPLVGALEGFRWSLLGTLAPPWSLLVVSLAVAGLMFVAGLVFFRRVEHVVADRI